MPISIKCQVCNAGIRVPDEWAGRKGKCPKCGNLLVVPPLATGPQPPPLPSVPAADSTRHSAETGDGLLGIQFAPPPPPAGSSAVIGKPKKKPSTAAVGATAAQAEAPPAADASGAAFSRQRRREGPPPWLWLVMAGLGLVIVVCGVIYGLKEWSPSPAAATSPQNESAALPPTESEPTAAATTPADTPAGNASPAEVTRLVEQALVRIEIQDGANREAAEETSVASGFVIHRSGLVATNYRAVAECTKADVLFNNGERFAVAGYVALRPDYDLAILKLEGVPADVQELTLSTESPQVETAVYSAGHRLDHALRVEAGAITALSSTADLPESSRRFLEEGLSDKVHTQWIRHSAATSVANSGGPLVNARGEVIGIDSFFDEESQTGFAVHAGHLDAMRRRLLPLAPLAKYRRRPQPVRQVTEQAAPPSDPASVSSEQVGELIAQLTDKQWQPETEADYDLFRRLALALSQARELGKKMEREPGGIPLEVKLVEQQADETAAALKEVSWKLETNIPVINQLAASSLSQKGAGVFLFGVYKYPAAARGQKGMVLQVAGLKQEIFVPYKLPPDLPEDACFLILGTAQGPGLLGDNPLLAEELPRIVGSVVFEIAP